MLNYKLMEFFDDEPEIVPEIAIKEEPAPHYIGHRKRVKERFVTSGAANFSDYELLELMLFSSIPRKDVKPLAKKLLENFSSITDLINIDKEILLSISGTNENLYINFAIVRELINRALKQKIINKNIIASWGSLIDYLKVNMGNMRLEQFRVLFLNKKNILIADEVLSQGTIDQAAVYPREIIKRALFNEASNIILVHNHPSGSPDPSKADIDMTNIIVDMCKTINIIVHDHVIISNNKYFSFKSNMLL